MDHCDRQGQALAHTLYDLPEALPIATASGTTQVTRGVQVDSPIGRVWALYMPGSPNLLSMAEALRRGFSFEWRDRETPILIDPAGQRRNLALEAGVPTEGALHRRGRVLVLRKPER